MRRRRLSFGSILMLLLCAAAIIGLVLFFQAAGGDSPAAAMDLTQIIDTVGEVIRRPLDQPIALVEGQTPDPLPTQQIVTARPASPISLSLTLGGMARFESDITASQSFIEGNILSALQPRLHADLNILGIDQVIVPASAQVSDSQMPVAALDMLRGLGIDSLVIAGEKALDQGYQGAQGSLQAMGQRQLRALGFGQGGLSTLKVNGLNIAWLHASQILSSAGQKATSQRERDQLLYPFDADKLTQQVRSLRDSHDIVIVSLNWPTAQDSAPTAVQGTLARRLGQAGADMILGMGGGRIQQLELYRLPDGQGGEREILIAYSLGNILSENRNRREAQSGALLHAFLTYEPARRAVRYDRLLYSPSYVRRYTQGNKVYFQVLLSAEQPPDNMSKAQRDQMAQSLRIVQEAFTGSPAQLQR